MPAQTNIDRFWFGEGTALEVSLDNIAFNSLGSFMGGVTATHNFSKEQIVLGNRTKTQPKITDQTIAIAPTALVSWDLSTIEKIGGGIYNYSSVAGTLVSGATQVTASGSWAFNKFIKILNQNGDGSAITVNSVSGATDGALTVDVDYYVGQNANGDYGIFIIDSVGVTTEAQAITINYDYTPSAGKTITAGTSSLVLDDFIIRLRHYTDVALSTYDAEMTIHKAALDSGIQFNLKGVNDDGLNEITMAFTGDIDDSRTDGDQLFSLYIAESALTSA